jgi:hypothetical protein
VISENPSGNAFLRLCVQEYRSHHSLQSCPIAPAFWCGAGCYAFHIGYAEDRAFGLLGSRHRRAASCSHGVRESAGATAHQCLAAHAPHQEAAVVCATICQTTTERTTVRTLKMTCTPIFQIISLRR